MLKELKQLLDGQGPELELLDHNYWRDPAGPPKHRKSARIREISKNDKKRISKKVSTKTKKVRYDEAENHHMIEGEFEIVNERGDWNDEKVFVKNLDDDDDGLEEDKKFYAFENSMEVETDVALSWTEKLLSTIPPAIRAEVPDFKPLGSKIRMQAVIEMACWEAQNNIDDDEDCGYSLDDLEMGNFDEHNGKFWGKFTDDVKMQVDDLIKRKHPFETFKAGPIENVVPLNEIKPIEIEILSDDEEDDDDDDDIEILETTTYTHKDSFIDETQIKVERIREKSKSPELKIVSVQSLREDNVSLNSDDSVTSENNEAFEETLLCGSDQDLMMDNEVEMTEPCTKKPKNEFSLHQFTSWFSSSNSFNVRQKSVVPSENEKRRGRKRCVESLQLKNGSQRTVLVHQPTSWFPTTEVKCFYQTPKRVECVAIRPLLQ